jgi:hypothetical protein
LKTLNDLFYDFIWDGKAKIKQSVIIKKYKEGGLNMVDTCIRSYVHSWKTRLCCDLDLQGSDPNVDTSSQYGDNFCEIVVKSDFK